MSNTCVTVQLLPRQKIILIHKYNVQTYEESVASIHHDINENIPEFFLKLRSVHDLRDVKAMSFMFIDAANFSSFIDAYNFRKKCQSFCKKNGIFYHFTTAATIKNSSTLSSTKTMVNEDEQIAILEITSAGEVAGTVVIRGKYCYDVYQILSPKEPVFTQEWKRLFFGISNPRKVILLKEMNNVVTENLYEQLEELFKGVTPVIVVDWKDHCETFRRVTAEHAQHVMGEKINPYHLSSHCLNGFRVMLSPGDDNGINGVTYEEDLLISHIPEQPLPFEESAIIPVDSTKCIKILSTFPMEYIGKIDLSDFKSDKVIVTLKIDINSCFDFQVIPWIPWKCVVECSELSTMNFSDSDIEKVFDKARIVIDKVNLFIYVTINGKEYMIKDPNVTPSSTKIPIYIAFKEKRPLIGQLAKEVYHEKPENVIFDLIKICSMDHADELSPFWKFIVDEKNEALQITFQSHDGIARGNVDFLLALILRYALQLIHGETNQRMKEFQIEFDGFNANKMLKKNFVTAGKLIDLGIVFGEE